MEINILSFIKIFAENHLQCLLIGGQALAAYGYARQTIDIDIMVDDADQGILVKLLMHIGFKISAQSENSLRFAHAEIPILEIDALLLDRGTFRLLYEAGTPMLAEYEQMRVPAPLHFIALKLHAIKNNPSRELKDISDVLEVVRRMKSEIDLEELRKICDQYGPKGIFSKIAGHLN